MKVYLNGEFVDASEAKVSVFDHGFLYGDGVFEGIRLYDGCVFKLEEHLERLEYSAKAIMLELPWSRAEISHAVCETCRRNELRDGYIRLVISRGTGTLGLSPWLCDQPAIIVIADKIQLYPKEYYTEGLKIVTVATRRIQPDALPPTIKSLNYLNNILAKIEARNAGCEEAIMLNDQGFVAECTGDNIFLVHKGKVYTPPAQTGALRGITRQVAIDIAAEMELPLVETNLTRYEVWTADEMFLTGTAAEVIPVVEVDRRPIGDGAVGSLTKQFIERFRKKVKVEGTML